MILTRVEKDGISLVFDETGEAYYPGYHALTRICGLNNQDFWDLENERNKVKRLIDRELKEQAVRTKNWKSPPSSKNTDVIIYDTPFLAEVKTAGGVQSVMLISRSLGTLAIRQFNCNLYDYMAELGHLVFLHQLVGYKITSSLIEPPKQPALVPETLIELPKQPALAPETLIKRVDQPSLDNVEMIFDRFLQNVKELGLDPRTPRIQEIARHILGVD